MNNLHVSAGAIDPERLLPLTESYIDQCLENHRMPNLAGLCRFLGISMEAFERLSESHREQIARIRDVLEDEALNSDMSPSLLSGYLKKRLGYDMPSEPRHAAADTGELKIVFEHDIYEDGQ